MRKITLLITFFISLFTFSQEKSKRYVYEVTINPDTVNLVKTHTERVFLDIKNGYSLFSSESNVKRDSIIQQKRDQKTQEKDIKGENNMDKKHDFFHLSYFNSIIQKNYNTQKEKIFERVGEKTLFYTEDRPIKWEITNDKENSLQKAITNFAGRKWTAWFDPEIKISDGPYKFFGLPGLIVKLEDNNGDYKFNLIRKELVTSNFEIPLTETQETTRENFSAEKRAFELEYYNKRISVNYNDNQNFKGGGRGGMGKGRSFGGRMNQGGMSNRRFGDNNASFPQNQNDEKLNGFFQGKNHNPIELK